MLASMFKKRVPSSAGKGRHDETPAPPLAGSSTTSTDRAVSRSSSESVLSSLLWPCSSAPAGASPYLSPYKKGSLSSPDLSDVPAQLDSPADAFHSFHHLERVPPGTPVSSKKGILRDPGRSSGAPASGSSVRFFSRDNVHVISPDASSQRSSSPFAEDLSLATGVPTLSSSLAYHDETAEPSFFPAAAEMPSTPLQGPASRSFLDRLNGISPATPYAWRSDGDLTIGMLGGWDESRDPTPAKAASSGTSPDQAPDDNLPTPTSSSFPYRDMESSVRSCGRSTRHDDAEDGSGGDSTQTVVLHAAGAASPAHKPRLANQSSFSSVLDLYSRSPPLPSPAAASSTPRKTPPSTSDSCGDLTVYHTPRADLQLRILQMEMESPAEDDGARDRSAFDPDASFSRSIVDRGLSPGQPGSPSIVLSFVEGDSVDYAPSSPLTPSLYASFPRAPSPGQQVLVPTSDVPALASDYYQSHQQLLAVTKKKYDLQVEISAELESSLRRKEAELKTARAQIERMGEVRDLEVRLEMERHDAAQAREVLALEASRKEEALALAADLQARLAQREAEVRDLEIKHSAAPDQPQTDPTPAASDVAAKLAERDADVALLQTQVEEQLAEIKRLASRLIDSVVDRDAALAQASALEQETIAASLSTEALEGKVADRERVIDRLTAQVAAQTAESMEEMQAILASHHRQSSDLRAQAAALEVEVARLRLSSAPGDQLVNADSSVLVVALAAARRDLGRLTEQAAKDARTITMHQEELDHQWKRADETHDDLARLKQHRDQLVESLQQTDETIDGLQADLTAAQEERDELLAEREDLIAERDDALANGGNGGAGAEDWEAERDELVAERDAILGERDAAWEEREDLLAQLDDHSQALADKIAEVELLTQDINSAQDRHSLEMEDLKRMRAANADVAASRDRYTAKADALQEQLAAVTATLNGKTTLVATLQARLDAADEASHAAASSARAALEDTCHARDKQIRALKHALAEKAREADELARDRSDLSRRFDGLVTEHASRSVDLQTSSFRSVAESGELERLTKQIAQLKSEDAAKEVRILHLVRSRDEVRETLEGVEIALDSKQQELELVKRKFGVRGVGGCTPAPAGRTSVAPGSVSRRHSLAPATPSVGSSSTPAFAPRASLGSAVVGVPETPGPLGRAAAARPRSSLAMGTPGLKHVPSVARPRSSLDTPSSVVPTPSTASRAPGARAAARLSAAMVAESPVPALSASTGAGASGRSGRLSTSLAPSSGRPLSEALSSASNATPRRASFNPSARVSSSAARTASTASASSSAGAAPTPRRSLGSSTPAPAKRLSLAPRFPSVDGVVGDLREDTGGEHDKENAARRERQLA